MRNEKHVYAVYGVGIILGLLLLSLVFVGSAMLWAAYINIGNYFIGVIFG